MIFVGDIGTQIKINVGEDISGYTTFQVKYRKPDDDKTTGTWTGSLDGTQTILYETGSGDIDTAGTWRVQGVVTDAAGNVFHTTIGEISVSSALDG